MSRYLQLLFALFFITLSTPALASPPEGGDAPAADAKADDAKADAPAEDAKADAKAEEAKADDAKEDAKADDAKEEAKATDGDGTGGDEKADTKEIETDEEAVEAAGDLYKALTDRNWALALAFGLALLVWLLRKVKVLSKVPAKAVPWVSAGLAAAGYVVAALMSGGAALGTALMEGAAAGAAAVGLWEMLLKHFLGGKKEGS